MILWCLLLAIIFVTFLSTKGVLKLAVHTICGWRQFSANNPFARDDRKPKRQLVTDRRVRDAVLRKEFDICKVSETTVSCVYACLNRNPSTAKKLMGGAKFL